jgi:hypothetical protein
MFSQYRDLDTVSVDTHHIEKNTHQIRRSLYDTQYKKCKEDKKIACLPQRVFIHKTITILISALVSFKYAV